MLIENLARQSKQEWRIAQQILAAKKEKERIIENRIERDKQYQEKRQLEYQQAIDLEYQLYENLRNEFQKTRELQMGQYHELMNTKIQKKHEKNILMCGNIVNELVNLTFKVAEHRRLDDYKQVQYFYEKLVNPGFQFCWIAKRRCANFSNWETYFVWSYSTTGQEGVFSLSWHWGLMETWRCLTIWKQISSYNCWFSTISRIPNSKSKRLGDVKPFENKYLATIVDSVL